MCFRYKEGKYPENMEKLTILNTSPLDADISFCFQVDSKAETFLLEPPTMQLKPGQQEVGLSEIEDRRTFASGGSVPAFFSIP